MQQTLPRGITLLETVLYIGLFGMILPAYTVFILQIWQQQVTFDARTRLEQSTALIFLETSSTLSQITAVNLTASTLGASMGVLEVVDGNGETVIFDIVETSVNFSDTTQLVHRARMQRGADPATWLTDPEFDVTNLQFDAVRDSSNALTGIRISLTATLINSTTEARRNASTSLQTTFALPTYTVEL